MSTLICRLVPIAQLKEMLSQQSSLETLQDCFSMRDVMVYGAHRVGWKRLEGESCWAIVCIILDDRKISIILDTSKEYLKDTSFFVSEDQTPKEQEQRRQAYAPRNGTQNAKCIASDGRPMGPSSLKIMFWNCQGYPQNKGLGLMVSDLMRDSEDCTMSNYGRLLMHMLKCTNIHILNGTHAFPIDKCFDMSSNL